MFAFTRYKKGHCLVRTVFSLLKGNYVEKGRKPGTEIEISIAPYVIHY